MIGGASDGDVISGVFYPHIGRYRGQPGHHNLVYELTGEERFDADDGTWEELFEEIAGQGRTLLSSEQFFIFFLNEPNKGARWLRSLRERFDVRILVSLRSYPDYLESLYTQHLRALTSDRPPQRFFKSQQRAVHRVVQTLLLLASLVGRERFEVLRYDRGRDVWLDFANALLGPEGAEEPAADTRPRVNARMGLNHLIALHKLAQHEVVRDRPWWNRIAISKELTSTLEPGLVRYTLMSPDIAVSITREAAAAFRYLDAFLETDFQSMHARESSDWVDIRDSERITPAIEEAVAVALKSVEEA